MMEEPRRLGNRYELGAVLGRGGMAEVYMARDIRLGRAVAVKTLRADMARDATFQARFRREAQSAASLNHPAIVAVYDTGEDYIGGISLPFIVMEYVDGSTLRDLLHSGRKLLPERSLEITGGVLQALDYSHRNGIVHRDIKPANVMLTRGGAVKVMDFGIARAMGDAGMTMTQTAAVIGTAQYLSPEQAKGEQVDARSDLYSTGCLIYELLTGRPPFIGDSPVAVAYQHVREQAQPPSYYDPEVPPVVDAIVMKSLAKSPDERYQSADEMRADLERALDGRPVAAAPTIAAGFGAAAPTAVMAPSGRGYGGGGGYGAAAAQTRYEPTAYQSAQEGPEDEIPRSRRAAANTGGRSPAKRDKTGWVIFGVAVVLIVLAGLVYKTVFSSSTGTTGTVPTITGLTVQEAKDTLSKSGYELGSASCQSGEANNNAVKAGEIVSQNPTSGKAVTTGTSVSYCVSAGPLVYTMPATVDRSKGTDVVNSLQKDGFTNVTTQTVSSNTVPSGNAIDIKNQNGNSMLGQKNVPVTTPLVVVISGGPGTTTVPSVVDQGCGSAEKTLQGNPYDFVVTVQNQLSSDGIAQNNAIGTNPSANSSATVGQAVTLICSQGPSPTTTTPTATGSATATATATDTSGFIGGLGGGNGNGGNGN
ncbi:MAG TPA: Stk1 family PASTA domain-containing Ser/Thr kinase [Actinospica sp.]|nr:Stk1 family PASTA domain-containing Ser/Thr kinase [Actinospica sp.]